MQEDLGTTYQKPSLENFCDALIREKDNLVQLRVIKTIGTSNKALVFHQKDKPKNPKKKHSRTTTSNIRVPNPLRQLLLLMETEEKNIKIRRLTNIATFVIKMVMMSPNVSRIW
jgi:hypothetical protein